MGDTGISDRLYDNLFNMADDPAMKAQLLATATKESGAWLSVLPVPHLGTKLDDTSVRIATGVYLGANIVESHKCVWGRGMVDCTGTHGLSCRKSSGCVPDRQRMRYTLQTSVRWS